MILHLRHLRNLLIPRPHSFLINSLLFGVGVIFAWLEGYRVQVGMPGWLFLLLWFVAQEILVQQAKYMWNDIRDYERDQEIPANKVRPIARSPLATSVTFIMAGR